MKKNIVQDVVPPKKSIRNVRLNSDKEPKKPVKAEVRKESLPRDEFTRSVPIQAPIRIESKPVPEQSAPAPEFQSYKYEFEEKKGKSKKWVYTSIFLLVLALAFGVSSLFKSAEIKVTPKSELKTISETFSAKKDAIGGLGYQTVSVTKDVEKTVKATGEEKVERKSRGTIVIYNNSTQVQKFVATTRFQTPEGLIYRLIEPVTIPSQITKDGKTVPGSIEVTVEADKPGVSYNVSLKDFTIPGLKGDPKYTLVYARSKTEMSGGFSGMQKTIGKDSLPQLETEMTETLRSVLSKDISAQIPANFVSFDEGISIESDPIVQIPASTEGDVILRKKGKATAIIFDKALLTQSINARVMSEVPADSVKILNIKDLGFKITTSSTETISFSLNGEANFIWTFDEGKLKNDLLGLSKKSAMTVISTYPGVSEAWVETKPFWNQKIPTNTEKVTLVNTATQ